MSVFRPAARVTAPDGQAWELYAYKLRVGQRGTFDPGLADETIPGYPNADVVLGALDALVWALALVPRLLVRVFWDIPRAAVAIRGSDEWTIEAVTWLPHRTSMTWRTTSAARHGVLRDLEGQLARGEPLRPRDATLVNATR